MKTRHLLEFAACRVILTLLEILPRKTARAVSAALFRVLQWLTPRFGRIAEQNLSMALPELSASQRREIRKGVYRSLGWMLAEVAHFSSLHRENLSDVVLFDGLSNYQRALAPGKGVIFLTAHLGAWELGAFAHGLETTPLEVVYRALDNPLLDRLTNRYRTLGGNRLIEKRESARGILAALGRNQTVGILADQNTVPEEGVFVSFFGIAACMTAGIARIALHSGAAVLPAFCIWDRAERRYRIVYEPALQLARTGNVEQDVQTATQQMAEVIERAVRRYPGQWLWIHRRWKTRPPGEPAQHG